MGNAPSTTGGLPAGHPDSVTSTIPIATSSLHYTAGGGGVSATATTAAGTAGSQRPKFPFVKEQYITDSPAASSPIDSEYASSSVGGGLGIGGADGLLDDGGLSSFRQQPRINMLNNNHQTSKLPGGGARRRASSLSTTTDFYYGSSVPHSQLPPNNILNEQALIASAAHQDRLELQRVQQREGADSRASYRNSARVSRAFGDLEPLTRSDDPGLRDGMVPTIITWTQGGNNVYVTGTFNNWKQKVRLNKSTNDFSTILNLPPGTHRIKFIVDDEWKCSTELSAATDAEGNLVNFLEVADEEQDELDGGQYTPINGSPVGSYTDQIPSYAQSASSSGHPSPSGSDKQLSPLTRTRSSEPAPVPADVLNDVPGSPSSVTSAVSSSKAFPPSPPIQQSQQPPAPAPPPPLTNDPPPGLPPHLEKVILNNAPSKEDNSVLPVPNHVVLNHLYACSVKEGVLSISVTSRYRKKYVTTVYIKPVVV
ncbi:hypothetical protein BGW41_003538 [Actinomortierella wolfii]|nr:hypothetical protein BGW41_003538 [Actinomortierella wolfii]